MKTIAEVAHEFGVAAEQFARLMASASDDQIEGFARESGVTPAQARTWIADQLRAYYAENPASSPSEKRAGNRARTALASVAAQLGHDPDELVAYAGKLAAEPVDDDQDGDIDDEQAREEALASVARQLGHKPEDLR